MHTPAIMWQVSSEAFLSKPFESKEGPDAFEFRKVRKKNNENSREPNNLDRVLKRELDVQVKKRALLYGDNIP